MRRLLCIIFFTLVACSLYGASQKQAKTKIVKPKVLQTDSLGSVNIRHLDSAALKAYKKQPEFQYYEDKTAPSWWDRFWDWVSDLWERFKKWLDHLFSTKNKKTGEINYFWPTFLKYLFIVLGGAALVFLIFKLIGVDIRNIFRRKPTSGAIPYSEFFEDINAISFDQEIENAVAKQNYRFAVRLLYLRSLKQLSDAGLIDWKIDKTNNTYINELRNEDQRTAFKILTRQFEYVWYGEFLIDAPVYSDIDLSFTDFKKRVA
jgi:hypothetical protein